MRNLSLLVAVALSCFGLQTQAATPSSGAVHNASPTIINDTKSLQVRTLETQRTKYKLSLRNTSQVAVSGVAILLVAPTGPCDLHTIRSAHGPLIAPSGINELEMDLPKKKPGWGAPGGESCANAAPDTREQTAKQQGSPAIIIASADFEDGTYEGDPPTAAIMESLRLGSQIGQQRIATLVEDELRGDQANDNKRINTLLSKVDSLPEDPDPAQVRLTMDRFSLPATASAPIQRDLQAGMAWQKTLFLDNLRLLIEYRSNGAMPRPTLQQWWATTKGQCDLHSRQSCENIH